MNAAEECLKKQLEMDRSHDPVFRAYMTIDDYKKENEELRKDKEWLDNTNNEQTLVILKLQEQIEKMKCCGNCKKEVLNVLQRNIKGYSVEKKKENGS